MHEQKNLLGLNYLPAELIVTDFPTDRLQGGNACLMLHCCSICLSLYSSVQAVCTLKSRKPLLGGASNRNEEPPLLSFQTCVVFSRLCSIFFSESPMSLHFLSFIPASKEWSCLITESQNDWMVEFVRDLCMSSDLTSLLKEGHPTISIYSHKIVEFSGEWGKSASFNLSFL